MNQSTNKYIEISFVVTNHYDITLVYLWYTNAKHNRRKDKINSIIHTRTSNILFTQYTWYSIFLTVYFYFMHNTDT